ncbi:MAG: hypothetical protein A2Y14_01980 [Verrucomicrobia bacterium GWF2_51_19]|nr:MAG: hypothetical protein A2Y14_01980 [Verrucomicrobia bacterium GWF2_51_19]HCJ11762.1 phosphoheptose isomerase [Opitutae bacterium]
MDMDSRLDELLQRYPTLSVCKKDIEAAFDALLKCYRGGGKLLICGNGGSASDADHIAGELLKAFCRRRTLSADWVAKLGPDLASNLEDGLPAIPLANLTGVVSAYSNDRNPQYVFAQLTFALGKPGDILLCISTSGNAENVLGAAQVARAKGMTVIGLSGETGGKLVNYTDVCIRAPERETFKIQEYHLPIYHALCLMIEEALFGHTPVK